MKKEYTRPELNIVSLVVEDTTNFELNKDDNRLSINGDLGDLFKGNWLRLFFVVKKVFYQAAYWSLVF